MAHKPRLFLDTSALFAGIWSSSGGARLLLRLGEAEIVELLISRTVVGEIETVFRKKAPDLLNQLTLLLHFSRVQVVIQAPVDLFYRCRQFISPAGDAQILADAWHHQVDYLVTLDKTHFLRSPPPIDLISFPIGTPGDCIEWLRKLWSGSENWGV